MMNKPHPFKLSNSRLDSLAKGDNHGMTWCVTCHEHENNEIHRNYEPFEILSIPIVLHYSESDLTFDARTIIQQLEREVESKRQAMEQVVDWMLRDYNKRLEHMAKDLDWLKADAKKAAGR